MSDASRYDQLDGQNIFVYRAVSEPAGAVDAEFGVGMKAPFTSVWIMGDLRSLDCQSRRYTDRRFYLHG